MEPNLSDLKLWLLVELEAYGGKNNYAIVDSEEVIGQPSKDNMHTGKNVKIRKGKITVTATIVIISDDKEFLDTELKQLKKMCALNLTHQQPNFDFNESPKSNRKRRKTANDLQTTTHTIYNPSTSTWAGTINQPNQNDTDRVLVPKSYAASYPNGYNVITQPMTFDQQTQTDTKYLPDNPSFNTNVSKMLSKQEDIIETQKYFCDDLQDIKKMLFDLSEQIQSIKSCVNDVNSKIDNNSILKTGQQPITYVLNSAQHSTQIPPVKTPLNQYQNYKIDMHKTEEDISTEEVTVLAYENEQSNISNSNNSNISFNDASNSTNCSSFIKGSNESLIKVENPYQSQILKSISTNQVSKTNKRNSVSNNSTTNLATSIIEDWPTSDEYFMLIGRNETKVPTHVLKSINWNSHTAATRKLLMTLFPRQVLASHSLTGKPSPAFMDRQKPAKNQLDPKIVSDIIQIVTQYCNVPESVVRNAITTKCADENKMNRQRLGKLNSSTVSLDEDCNKENFTDK